MHCNRGVGLIELLIVVMVIAALVGVAVPFFGDNLAESQSTRCHQDLDVLRNAVTLHDAQNGPSQTGDLQPLLGRYLQEIPKDPWGNSYQYDAARGVVTCLGPDGVPSADDRSIAVPAAVPGRMLSAAPTPSWMGVTPPVERPTAAAELPAPDENDGACINPFVCTVDDAVSTFSADVDTASYTMTRDALGRGVVPAPNRVRVEEFVNYFDYAYAAPDHADFTVHTEAAPSPYDPSRLLVRVGLRARDLQKAERPRLTLTFVVDVSGSMAGPGRLGLVKQSLKLLLDNLHDDDRVALTTYDDQARIVVPMTPVAERRTLVAAVDRLATGGSTCVEAGLRLGYGIASRERDQDGTNRVILCSDGVANAGCTLPSGLLDLVRSQAGDGIFLTAVGVGMGDCNDRLLEQLADGADGTYAYIDDIDEARRLFCDDLAGSMFVVARDLKIQATFDPAAVRRWRLLGYENRDLADKDFRDDKKDAAEIGAGDSVTALYEIEPAGEANGTVGVLRLRYGAAKGNAVTELQLPLVAELSSDGPSLDYRVAVLAAQLAELLRRSPHAVGLTPTTLHERARSLLLAAPGDERCIELERLAGQVLDAAAKG